MTTSARICRPPSSSTTGATPSPLPSATVLMLPTVTRSSEEMLRLVPSALREGAYALGIPKWKTIMKIVLPTAAAGIVRRR